MKIVLVLHSPWTLCGLNKCWISEWGWTLSVTDVCPEIQSKDCTISICGAYMTWKNFDTCYYICNNLIFGSTSHPISQLAFLCTMCIVCKSMTLSLFSDFSDGSITLLPAWSYRWKQMLVIKNLKKTKVLELFERVRIFLATLKFCSFHPLFVICLPTWSKIITIFSFVKWLESFRIKNNRQMEDTYC